MTKEVKEMSCVHKLILPEQPYYDDFLQIMSNVFHYSCWFGVMRPRSIFWRVWSITLLLLLVHMEGHTVWKVIKALAGWAIDMVGHRSVTSRLAGTIFYSSSIMSLILSSRLHLSWPELAQFWTSVERSMTLNVGCDSTLKKRMVSVICFMTCFCAMEHLMSILSLIGFDCPSDLILKKYTLLSHGFMILRHEYQDWMAIPVLVISTLATVLWNFMDLVIVLISMGLTSRYHRLNSCVAKISALERKEIKLNKKKEAMKAYTWRKIREAYVKQAILVRKVDEALGGMIILSCFCGFYFICLQLFMGITQGKHLTSFRRFFYIVSLTWVSVRVSSVVLAASAISVHSKKALKHIYACDAQFYNIEMERLQNQLTKDHVALSGMGFFYLNRNILLQMVGAIITYELVLIQLDNDGSNDTPSINATRI